MTTGQKIFDYNNFREFLKDYYEEQKAKKTGFTYARFSSSAGIRSPNYFKLVMDKKKSLTPTNLVKFALALELEGEEKDYFEALVQFNQANTQTEREYFFEKVKRLREKRSGSLSQRVLKEYEFEAISSWTHHAVMLLTNLSSFRESPRWISRKLYGLVSESEVISILSQLETIGLLSRDEHGKLKQTTKRIKTQPDLKRQSTQVFYEGILLRAMKSLSLDKPDEREFGAYMVGLSPEQLPELKHRVREFMNDLNEWALENENPEEIYSFVFSGFPLSHETKKEEKL